MVLPPAVTMKSRARSTSRSAPRLSPFADVAGAQPAVGGLDRSRCFVVAPIALEQIGAVNQDLAILRQANVPARRRRADIAGRGKRSALAADDPARGLRLTVYFDDVDAVHLPERHALRRQRRAAADDQFQLIEAELVQDRPEHEGLADCVGHSSRSRSPRSSAGAHAGAPIASPARSSRA